MAPFSPCGQALRKRLAGFDGAAQPSATPAEIGARARHAYNSDMDQFSSPAAAELFSFVLARDAEQVAQRLQRQPSLAKERVKPSNSTPLIEAARRADAESLRALIPHGDPMATDAFGCCALSVAAEGGAARAVELLLRAAPAAQDIVDGEGFDALMRAAANGRVECVKLLARPGFCSTATASGLDALSLSLVNIIASDEEQWACAAILAPLASEASLAHALGQEPPKPIRALIQALQNSRIEADALRQESASQSPSPKSPRL